jgi:hypothetical protein
MPASVVERAARTRHTTEKTVGWSNEAPIGGPDNRAGRGAVKRVLDRVPPG